METNCDMPVFNWIFTRAEIPEVWDPHHPHPADIFAVDDESYFHVTFCDEQSMKKYLEMLQKMEREVKGSLSMPQRWSNRPGTDCIIEYNGRRGGSYVRGKVIEPADFTNVLTKSGDYVKCEVVDDALEIVVHRTQLFQTSCEILNYPRFTLKCELVDMDMFVGKPFLQTIFKEYMRGELMPFRSTPASPYRFTVSILNPSDWDRLPLIRVITGIGEDVTDLLQQYIPTVGTLEYPRFKEEITAKITHCDAKGDIWFQPIFQGEGLETNLSSVVKSRLALYNDGYLDVPTLKKISPSSWKNLYFQEEVPSVGGILYVYKSEAENRCYRIRKLCKQREWRNGQGSGDVWAFFVDHGNIQVVEEDKLVPAHLVDQNLSFIPPQCLPARFVGASCNYDGDTVVNLQMFWKYVNKQPVSIILNKNDDKTIYELPDAVLSNRLLPAAYVDHALNFLPPPCIPVRFKHGSAIVADHNSICCDDDNLFSFDRQIFWIHCKNKPVSVVWKDFIVELEKTGGRFQGGLFLPEADIFVELPGASEPRSLYDIFHTLKFCCLHSDPKDDPSVIWNPPKEIENILEKSDAEEEGIEEDSGIASGGSGSNQSTPTKTIIWKPGNEDGLTVCGSSPIAKEHSIPYSWVDWAAETLMVEEYDWDAMHIESRAEG